MTYQDMLLQLQTLSEEQLQKTATVYTTYCDEYVEVKEIVFTTDVQSVLDEDHPVLVIEF